MYVQYGGVDRYTIFLVEKNSTDVDSSNLKIPDWIKNNAGWWAADQITDSDFSLGIEFMINDGIIVIPPTVETTNAIDDTIPGWIKNNAGWWSENKITDQDFALGIKFLVENGIIRV